jgi:hypothetical protein
MRGSVFTISAIVIQFVACVLVGVSVAGHEWIHIDNYMPTVAPVAVFLHSEKTNAGLDVFRTQATFEQLNGIYSGSTLCANNMAPYVANLLPTPKCDGATLVWESHLDHGSRQCMRNYNHLEKDEFDKINLDEFARMCDTLVYLRKAGNSARPLLIASLVVSAGTIVAYIGSEVYCATFGHTPLPFNTRMYARTMAAIMFVVCVVIVTGLLVWFDNVRRINVNNISIGTAFACAALAGILTAISALLHSLVAPAGESPVDGADSTKQRVRQQYKIKRTVGAVG